MAWNTKRNGINPRTLTSKMKLEKLEEEHGNLVQEQIVQKLALEENQEGPEQADR